MNSRSCCIFFTNLMIVGIVFYFFQTKMHEENRLLEIIAAVLGIYCSLSPFLATYGFFRGLKECRTRGENSAPVIGTIGNALYLITVLFFLVTNWEFVRYIT